MLKAALTRLARGSFVYGIGGVLQRFMGLLLLPFFTRVLTPEDYGVVALVTLVGVALSGLLTLGTVNSLGLLYYREQDPLRRPAVIWTNILLLTVNGICVYMALYVLAPTVSGWIFQTGQYGDLILLALLGNVFSVIADPWLAYLRMEEKAKHYVAIILLGSALQILLAVYFVLFLGSGITGLVLAGTLAHGIMIAVIWWSVGRKLQFGIDRHLFKPLVRIGFPSVFGLFAFLIIDYADRQMIERMLGLTELGIYSIGYSFGMVMTVAMGAFSTAWPPFFMSYVKKHEEARHVFARVLTYYVLGFGALIVLFFFIAKPAVMIMTASAFHDAYLVVGLVAAAYALKGCYLILLPGIYFVEKLHRQSIIEWIAALANIALNLWLIPAHGIFGAAVATLVSYLLLAVLAWLVARNHLQVDYEWRRLAWILSVIVIAATLLYQVSILSDMGLVETILVNSVIASSFLVAMYRLLLTGNEREKLVSLVKP